MWKKGDPIPKLTKKQKVSIVRDIMSRMPNYKYYGFNRELIRIVKELYGITIRDNDISRYISAVEKQWQESALIIATKQQLKDMLTTVYQKNADNPNAQIRSIHEMGKLDGHYVEKSEVQNTNENQVFHYYIPDNGRDPKARKEAPSSPRKKKSSKLKKVKTPPAQGSPGKEVKTPLDPFKTPPK